MRDRTINHHAEEAADTLSGVIRCYTLLNEMQDTPAPTSAQAAHEWAQTFEATWKEAQHLMAQARALGWRGKLNGFMPKQSPYRARKIYALCYMVRLGATTSASEALNAAAALISGFYYKGEVSANLDHLRGDLAYLLASAQIKAEKKVPPHDPAFRGDRQGRGAGSHRLRSGSREAHVAARGDGRQDPAHRPD